MAIPIHVSMSLCLWNMRTLSHERMTHLHLFSVLNCVLISAIIYYWVSLQRILYACLLFYVQIVQLYYSCLLVRDSDSASSSAALLSSNIQSIRVKLSIVYSKLKTTGFIGSVYSHYRRKRGVTVSPK